MKNDTRQPRSPVTMNPNARANCRKLVWPVAIVAAVVGLLCSSTPLRAGGSTNILIEPRPVLSPSEAQIISNIVLVEYLIPKRGERQTDPHAAAIIALGSKGAPQLADAV